MPIHFEKIDSDVEIQKKSVPATRTVLEELAACQELLEKRTIKCPEIKPFFERTQKPSTRYLFHYQCVCPRYKPQYSCKHSGNIIIDRDVLSQEEHIVYLSTPKENYAAPRKMPRYFLKRSIIANCTARINRLAKPDRKHVSDTLNNFNHVISRRHKKSLKKCLEISPNVEYTTIPKAMAWLREEKRLKRVAQRKRSLLCRNMTRKILQKQRQQIKKIIGIMFEEMKDFLLNDQFIMDDSSALVSAILDNLREFTDKEFHITSNLREYQKILASNIAIWINKFIFNLNIHVAEPVSQYPQMPQHEPEREIQELTSFLPLGGYISASDEDYFSNFPDGSEKPPMQTLGAPSEMEELKKRDISKPITGEKPLQP